MKTKQEHLIELEEDLAPWLPREKETANILSSVAEVSSTLDSEISSVEEGLTLQEANSKAEIEAISDDFDVNPKESESVGEYKKRALKTSQNLTNNGSPEDILETAATLFNIGIGEISIENIENTPAFQLEVDDKDAIDTEFGSFREVMDLINESTAANYSVNFFIDGTMDYISPSDRANNNYDSTEGYASLYSDGDLTVGGTYSGYFFDITNQSNNYFEKGTLNYITSTNRANNNYDPAKGFAGLDADGNPTAGGTYSGYNN